MRPTQELGKIRRGGRSARRALRQAPKTSSAAILKRQIPTYELLSEEGLVQIEDAADTILQEVGMEFRGDPEVLEIWRQAGADVKGERVRFERGMPRKIIQATAPREFMQQARNPERSVIIGGDNIVFAPALLLPSVRDLDNGRRSASIKDLHNLIKLTYVSPWMHHSTGAICEPVDLPATKRHLDIVYSQIRYTDKPFMGATTSGERAEDSLSQVRILFGDEFVDNNCVLVNIINVNSPLVLDSTMLEALKVYTRANQATIITPFILSGAMGPVTMAGTLAQLLAEAMGGIALTQLIRPGCPVIFGTFMSSLSLRTGTPTYGTPEPGLGYMATGQLARRLGVPLRGNGSLTSSKIADWQDGQESADTLMPTILAGVNLILHSAGRSEGGLCLNFEKFVLDMDHVGMMHTFVKGLALDDNGFALDAFREVGPGKNFFVCQHTLANYETAFYESEIADHRTVEDWTDAGSPDAARRANTRMKQMLAEYEAPPLDPAVDEELVAFMEKRKTELPDTLT
jgi:trimethylamine--corrinoid protein Co-methyltransferase